MSINVSAWAIRRPLPAVLLFVLLGAAGIAGFRSLAISRFPDISLPMVMITVMIVAFVYIRTVGGNIRGLAED